MRSNILVIFFLALFALFSTVTYAAPVPPQGEISKRQCTMYGCRNASTGTNPPSSGSSDANMLQIISALINFYNAPAQPAASSTVAPATPTGK